MRSLPLLALVLGACPGPATDSTDSLPPDDSAPVGEEQAFYGSHVVLAWPDRGMSPMDPGYGTFALRPPGVTLRAQVVHRGSAVPDASGLTLEYAPIESAAVSGSTDFWDHAPAMLGAQAPATGVGLDGLGLEGALTAGAEGTFAARGVPVVPASGSGSVDPFPLFRLRLADAQGEALAATLVVAPTSWDRGCGRCHGSDPEAAILAAHDTAHETTLQAETPVRCGACHAQPELGWPGDGEAASLAVAMHGAHAERMSELGGAPEPVCLACHPGPDTPWYRGNHSLRDIGCVDCHGTMEALVAEGRTPWVDLPRCDDCHATPGVEYQQPGVSWDESRGHGGVRCGACHHAAHGLYKSTLETDNAQNQALQGYPGVVSNCRLCHDPNPGGLFPHVLNP